MFMKVPLACNAPVYVLPRTTSDNTEQTKTRIMGRSLIWLCNRQFYALETIIARKSHPRPPSLLVMTVAFLFEESYVPIDFTYSRNAL